MMNFSEHTRWTTALFVLVLGVTDYSTAQTVSLTAAAECFEAQVSQQGLACQPGVKSIVHYIAAGPTFSLELAEAALDQLERLAIGSLDAQVRGTALTYIGVAGQPSSGTDLVVLPRLERIYWASDSHIVRSNAMAFAHGHTNKGELVEFLGRIAHSEPDPDVGEFSLAARAVASLAQQGEPGIQVLRRLASENLSDPSAGAQLRALEAQGWTLDRQ